VRLFEECNTEVVLDAAAPLPRLQSLVQWLARHAALIKGITLKSTKITLCNNSRLPVQVHLDMTQLLLQLCLHVAAEQPRNCLPPAAAAAATAIDTAVTGAALAAQAIQAAKTVIAAAAALATAEAAAEPATTASMDATKVAKTYAASLSVLENIMLWISQQQQRQQQQGLRLRSFSSSNLPKAVDMLAVLHPHSLTCVDLDMRRPSTDSSALSAALVRLSGLQQLRLVGMPDASHVNALRVITQLSQLTSLELSGRWPSHSQGRYYHQLGESVSEPLRQLLAQPRPLQQLVLDLTDQLPVLNNTTACYLRSQFCQLSCSSWLFSHGVVLTAWHQ
jgi:hypothetical protein